MDSRNQIIKAAVLSHFLLTWVYDFSSSLYVAGNMRESQAGADQYDRISLNGEVHNRTPITDLGSA